MTPIRAGAAMIEVSLLVPIALLALALVPGLHFDLMRVRRRRLGPGNAAVQIARIIIASTLTTTTTLILLGVLGQGSLVSLGPLLDENGGDAPSPLAAGWSAVCFLALSLTLSSLAAAILARLENHPGPFSAFAPSGTRRSRRAGDYEDRDIELEITLNTGQTFRGMLGEETAARGYDSRFLTMNGPIFQLDGHGRPLPLDALHWDQMVVPTRAVTSVLVRPVEEQPQSPPAFRGVPSRHSAPRLQPSDQLKILVEWCYERRHAPAWLARLLVLEIIVIALVGAVASAVS
ncbi:MAG TPA: DUF6338 family protein [Spirillospora sp.]